MSATPVISIIVPLYNAEHWVLETLQSIQQQTYQDWEVVAVDDGSKDNGPKLVTAAASQDARIKLLHQTNAGPAAARRYGAKEAHGQWLLFLDADDLLPPDRLTKDLAVIQAHPDVGAITSAVEWFSQADGKTLHHCHLAKDKEVNLWHHTFYSVFNFAGMVVKRDAYFACGGFINDPKTYYAEDYDYTLRLLSRVEMEQTTGISVRIRKHEGNRSTLAETTVIEHTLEVLRRYWSNLLPEVSPDIIQLLFRFWRMEPIVFTAEELSNLITAHGTYADAYVKKRPQAAKAVALEWERRLALRLYEAGLSGPEETDLMSAEKSLRGWLASARLALRLRKMRWRR